MYADNNFGRRRPEGWAERRRFFRKLLERARSEAHDKQNDTAKRP